LNAGVQSSLNVIGPRTLITRRTIRCGWFGRSWIGMKSCTSPTPWRVRKRVISTLVSGR
jgi:hypothetical protein